ncbi:MAG TPA: hypothetical protein VJY35_15505 [Candidatus Eisenbacteria bacterium]|nr:hypothetical protein [Candidatus Eisenbacteria bacterium]
MDPSNPVAVLLNPAVFSALSVFPFVLEYVKSLAERVFGDNAKKAAAITSALTVIGIVTWSGLSAHLTALEIAAQSVIAWVYVEAVYRAAIQPAAKNTNNPVLPTGPAPDLDA